MNVFEFSTKDLTTSEKEFYKPFRLEVPQTELCFIEDYIVFCKNVATLLSFSEATFENGIKDYLEGITRFDDCFIYDIVKRLGKDEVNKIINEVEEDTCVCDKDCCENGSANCPKEA